MTRNYSKMCAFVSIRWLTWPPIVLPGWTPPKRMVRPKACARQWARTWGTVNLLVDLCLQKTGHTRGNACCHNRFFFLAFQQSLWPGSPSGRSQTSWKSYGNFTPTTEGWTQLWPLHLWGRKAQEIQQILGRVIFMQSLHWFLLIWSIFTVRQMPAVRQHWRFAPCPRRPSVRNRCSTSHCVKDPDEWQQAFLDLLQMRPSSERRSES